MEWMLLSAYCTGVATAWANGRSIGYSLLWPINLLIRMWRRFRPHPQSNEG